MIEENDSKIYRKISGKIWNGIFTRFREISERKWHIEKSIVKLGNRSRRFLRKRNTMVNYFYRILP